MAGRILDEDVEEVRRRANLGEVAADYMQLKRAGGARLKALCPFHAEKTASFTLDPSKGLFICFGCGKGGNVYTLLMELEGLTFVEAVERLAQRVGITLRYENATPADRQAYGRRRRLVDAHRVAVEFYEQALGSSPEAAEARAYWRSRKLAKATAETFRIGYSPKSGDKLVRHLREREFSDDLLVAAGLARRGERGLTDAFRGRLMFPVFDLTGDPIAFGARLLEGSGPKYLNSAESPIWQKGKILYSLHAHKAAIVKEGRALVVEGYTDVIALAQVGLPIAVASCGTAIGIEHFRLLRRFTDCAVLAYDADSAGQAATERAFDEAFAFSQETGIDTMVVQLPAGTDPADLALDQGGEAFRSLADRAVSVLEHRLRREISRAGDVRTPEGKARSQAAVAGILRKVANSVVNRKYAVRAAGWIGVDEDMMLQAADPDIALGAVTAATVKRLGRQVRLEREALKLALQFPDVVERFVDRLEEDDLSVKTHRTIWRELKDGPVDVGALASRLGNPAGQTLTVLAMEDVEGEASDRLAEEIFSRLKEFALVRQIDEVKERLQRLNPITSEDEYRVLSEELFDLEQRRRELSPADQR